MSHRNEGEEEEEEEEDEEYETPIRRSSAFKVVTGVTPNVNQSPTTGTLQTTDSEYNKIVHEITTRTEAHETVVRQEQQQVKPDLAEAAKKEEETRREIEARQAKLLAEQKEAMIKAQQEALQRAQLAQQKAIKEAQERAQRDAQMRVQRVEDEAKARQAEIEAKNKQAQAEAKARQIEAEAKARQAEAKKRTEQEALRRAELEARNKAERERAQMMATKQAQQVPVQTQNLQQNQTRNVQKKKLQQQQRNQQSNQLQSQVPIRQSQIPGKQPQTEAPQQQQQKKAPEVPTKPLIRPTVPSQTTTVNAGQTGGKFAVQRNERNVLQTQSAPMSATPVQQQRSQLQLIGNTEERIQVMRGGDVQQAYLNNVIKPASVLPQQEVKPIHTQDDQSWVIQSRKPVEIQAPQPAKITIPELHGTVDVKPTVIIPRPMQTTRVEWNEFPQEETKELRNAPKVKAGEWHPENQSEIIGAQSVRSAYQPGRIGHVWPPPQNENEAPPQDVTVIKAAEDTAWRRDEKVEVETETAWSKAAQHNLQTVWPPPENEVRAQRSAGSRLKTIQWPPTELEQQIQHDVDILQTRLPVRPNQRQWPPPPPEYGPVIKQNGTVAERKEIIKQEPNQQIPTRNTVTKGMVRVGGAR